MYIKESDRILISSLEGFISSVKFSVKNVWREMSLTAKHM